MEIGCGPARLLPMMSHISGIQLTGIDHDATFVAFAKETIAREKLNANVIQTDFTQWTSEKPVDIFYSQGFHHHVGKGKDTKHYLDTVHQHLGERGVYILSDEFLPEYNNEDERKIKAVVWYSHIIASAKRLNYTYLAQEEAKTLLDDLHEGNERHDEIKNEKQISLVLDRCAAIDKLIHNENIAEADATAQEFLQDLAPLQHHEKSGDVTIDLSRGDYKICDSVLRKEIAASGFEVIERKTVGPIETIGGMAIYVLRKTL